MKSETSNPSTSFTADTPASPSRKQDDDWANKTRAISGPSSLDAFAYYDPDSLSWKTCQATLFSGSVLSLPTWPKHGMTCGGYAYELQISELPTDESVSSVLLATPTTSDMKGPSPNHGGTLAEHIALLPTPGANDMTGGGSEQSRGGGPDLRGIDHLLPTPAAQEPGGTVEQHLWRKNRLDGANRVTPTHLSLAVKMLPAPADGGSTPHPSDDGNSSPESMPLNQLTIGDD